MVAIVNKSENNCARTNNESITHENFENILTKEMNSTHQGVMKPSGGHNDLLRYNYFL